MKTESQIIMLSSTEVFYTESEADSMRVLSGTALVYIVPWKKAQPGRKVLLRTVEQGKMIPSLCYTDVNYQKWKFAVLSKAGNLKLEIMPGCSTKILKKRFLEETSITSFDEEGYESSLVNFYERESLKDEVFIGRVRQNDPSFHAASYDVIARVFQGKEDIALESENSLYRTAAWACKACRQKIAPWEKLCSIYGKDIAIPDMISASNMICREIVLETNWFQDDCGVLVGTMEGQPVACVPKEKGRYYIFYGQTGKSERLTKQAAEKMGPKVFGIGRTLPAKSLGLKELFWFGMGSILGRDILSVLLLGMAGALTGTLIPTLYQKVYDRYIPLGNDTFLIQLCIVAAFLMAGSLLFMLPGNLMDHRIACKAGYDMQNAVYHRVLHLPESFFSGYDSADLARRVMSAGSIANKAAQSVVTAGFSTLFSLVYFVRMLTYSAGLTFTALFMVFAFALVIWLISLRVVRYERKIEKYDGKAAARLYQYLKGIDKVRMAGMEERSIYEYLMPFSLKQAEDIKRTRLSGIISILSDTAGSIFSMALYWMLIKKNMELSVGSFIAFNSAFGYLSFALFRSVRAGVELYGLKPEYERLQPVFSTVPEYDEDKSIPEKITGSIALENVTFSYQTNGAEVLKNLSLDIKPGEYVGIVGPSGCGKSTLFKLLLGFESPKSGRVCYDNHDLKSLNKKALRKRIGVVLQNGRLTSGSIFENITITNSHASLSDVNKVIEAVGLKEDIENMPMGIHTIVNESSGTISGGQRQRILIARAIFNQPSLLLFDEATSALDNLTQAMVCESLEQMHITRIVIAHRLSTIKNCDRILVINDGSLLEEGNYETLMDKKGLFYQMAGRQLAE